MALIKCPECSKTISDKSQICINCGFPLENNYNHIENEKTIIEVSDFKKTKVKRFNRWLFEADNQKNSHLSKNLFSKGDVFEFKDNEKTSIGKFELSTYSYIDFGTIASCSLGFENIDDEIIKRVHYISIELENSKIIKSEHKIEIECPNCGSFEVKRISNAEKVTNIALFGLFGNKRKKQFVCNKCKFMW